MLVIETVNFVSNYGKSCGKATVSYSHNQVQGGLSRTLLPRYEDRNCDSITKVDSHFDSTSCGGPPTVLAIKRHFHDEWTQLCCGDWFLGSFLRCSSSVLLLLSVFVKLINF